LGILDWYTLSVAVFTLICLGAHGASYLALKTEGDVHRRAQVVAKQLWLGAVFLLLVVSAETIHTRPELFLGAVGRPVAWVALALVAGGLTAIFTALRSGAELRMFAGGCVLIAGLLASAAASLFPVILYSTVAPEYSITAYNGSSDASSLRAASYWWPAAFVLAVAYFGFVARHYRGRVRISKEEPY
jgi:cytochrome d ubiquinol oxidase subunit II